MALPRLLRLLPRLDSVTTCTARPARGEIVQYSPTLTRLGSILYNAMQVSSTVNSLTLDSQWFASTADVLRLLALFPQLHRVTVNGCIIQTKSTTVSFNASPASRLMFMDLYPNRDAYGPQSYALAQWWQWPHPASDPVVGAYPGLHRTDTRIVVDILSAFVVARNMPSR